MDPQSNSAQHQAATPPANQPPLQGSQNRRDQQSAPGTQANPQVLQVSEVTPRDPRHIGYGRVFTIIGQVGEFIEAELKDLVHDVKVMFHNSQVKPIVTPAPPQPAGLAQQVAAAQAEQNQHNDAAIASQGLPKEPEAPKPEPTT